MEFTKELLFVGGFILVIVLFIQYLSYSRLKKMIKTPRKSKHGASNNTEDVQQVEGVPQSGVNQSIGGNQNTKRQLLIDDDDIEIDTPDEDADSYVNPVHSEKHIDDDNEIEEK
jgi:hypothetical protein